MSAAAVVSLLAAQCTLRIRLFFYQLKLIQPTNRLLLTLFPRSVDAWNALPAALRSSISLPVIGRCDLKEFDLPTLPNNRRPKKFVADLSVFAITLERVGIFNAVSLLVEGLYTDNSLG
jgi:hypothetical protein